MDRLMVYPGAIPLDTDVLSVERNVMTSLGWLMQAALGTGTGVVGLACNPTVPASMTVNIGPGALWAQAVIDQSSFGSLPADSSPLMKMGSLPEAAGTNFTLSAPQNSGQSINYLIEAAFEETDSDPVVLPYVNPANPSQPYTGPDNSGTPQNTVRAQSVALQLKAGVAANTGTQTTPDVDEGYVGLYVITVNFGQTAITAADIKQYANAPFLGGPFAPLAGNAGQTFAGAPAAQSNQFTTLGQFENIAALGRTAWVTAPGPINHQLETSVSFTAPCNGMVYASGAINIQYNGGINQHIVGINNVPPLSADVSNVSQAHFAALQVTEGETVTATSTGGSFEGTTVGQFSLWITAVFIPSTASSL